jgi:hypothetical protein
MQAKKPVSPTHRIAQLNKTNPITEAERKPASVQTGTKTAEKSCKDIHRSGYECTRNVK